MITFSIIIPCYNVAPYIDKCIDSILSLKTNELYNYEIIFVYEKSSSDITIDIINEYYNKYNKVRNIVIIEDSSHDLSTARNLGYKYCNGDYIWFIDGDDWIIDINSLEYFYNVIIKNNKLDLIFFDFYMSGSVIQNQWSNPCSVIWSFIIKNSFFDNYKFTEGLKRAEDGDYVNRYVHLAKEHIDIHKCLYHYNYPRKGSGCYNIYIKDGIWKEGEINFDKDGIGKDLIKNK